MLGRHLVDKCHAAEFALHARNVQYLPGKADRTKSNMCALPIWTVALPISE